MLLGRAYLEGDSSVLITRFGPELEVANQTNSQTPAASQPQYLTKRPRVIVALVIGTR